MYDIYLVTKVFFVFTRNKEFQTTRTIKIILFCFILIHVDRDTNKNKLS